MSSLKFQKGAFFPVEAICVQCLKRGLSGPTLFVEGGVCRGTAANCTSCCGTQREPVPFSEVWGMK